MNIIVPNMLQNALTQEDDGRPGGRRRGQEDQGPAERPLRASASRTRRRRPADETAAGRRPAHLERRRLDPCRTPSRPLGAPTCRDASEAPAAGSRSGGTGPTISMSLPALGGDAARHRLSGLLHDLPLLLQHAAEPGAGRQDLCRARQLLPHPDDRELPRGHLEHLGLDVLLDALRFRAWASARRWRSTGSSSGAACCAACC